MSQEQDYKNLINDIIDRQSIILGSDIVLLKARSVPGLTLDSKGEVEKIEGNPQAVLQNLIDEYIALSGQIVKNILNPIMAKYPEIKININ